MKKVILILLILASSIAYCDETRLPSDTEISSVVNPYAHHHHHGKAPTISNDKPTAKSAS